MPSGTNLTSFENPNLTEDNASLAQQESQSLSQNVRLGLQYRYQQGKVQVCTNRFLGYDKDEEGKLIINPEEAEVVRRIYREYLEGKSYYDIGKGLTADGIKTAAGSDFWLATTLRKILRKLSIFDLLQTHPLTPYISEGVKPSEGGEIWMSMSGSSRRRKAFPTR